MALCRASASQVLLVDLQTRLFAAMPLDERAAVIRAAGILAQAAISLDLPLLYTEQYPKGLGPTEPDIAGQLPGHARRFEKTGFSCNAALGFAKTLKMSERPQIVLAGQETHVCVLQTAFDLLEEGYAVFVVEEGVCSRNAAHKRNALERMVRAGVTITNLESVLFEWLADAAHPQFKALSALIR
jgi:nicotinamidase-related amidase